MVQTSETLIDSGAVQKGADFVRAFALGFEVKVGPLVCKRILLLTA